jgi:hypothetical protein
MARRYVPAGALALVTEATVAAAQARLDGARGRLREAEGADPASQGWDGEFDAASAAVRAAERRLEALTSLRAAQVERSGRRAETVKSSAKELASIAAGLAASRDAVAAAAAENLRGLANLATVTAAHNERLASGRGRLAELGLATVDDLLDIDRGEEHPEGTLGRTGVRVSGTDWTPVEARALADSARLQVFKDRETQAGRFRWRPHELGQRPDGLAVPTLAGIGAAVPAGPPPVPRPKTPSIRDLMAAPGLSMTNPDWKPRPAPKRQTARSA